ncbi:MAG: DUF5702 domain-containing protein [Clostridiales bacterium]|nr:DUF5702 domain-containing protein [Clostridiales bacterium]
MFLKREEGQITVFLALLFTVMMGLSLCILEGMKAYTESSLAEDALKGAGNYVLANYDRSLFQNYHVYFTDPRERQYLVSDGEEYLSEYMNDWSFFDFSCGQLAITEEKTTVEEDGLYLKHQIREWMKYREIAEAGEILIELLQSTEKADEEKNDAKSDIDDAQNAIDEDAAAKAEQPQSEDSGQQQSEDADSDPEEQQESPEEAEKKAQWKGLVSTMKQIFGKGILYYVIDDPSEISEATISTDSLPSADYLSELSESGTSDLFGSSFSFTDVGEWKNVLSGLSTGTNVGTTVVNTLADEFYLLEYISDCFRSYTDEKSGDRALKYEVEYLIHGKASDQANLKAVANRLLCIRFIVNYAYLSKDETWIATTETTTTILLGLLGLPEAQKAVQILLTAAVSLAESLLDVHALFAGEKIPITKSEDTWNLTLANAATLLVNKGPVKEGTKNVGYEEFLQLFLIMKTVSKKFIYRMMDVMQLNVALEEEGFLMKECLFAFRWEGQFTCNGLFSFFPGTGKQGSGGYEVQLERLNSY